MQEIKLDSVEFSSTV